MANWAATEQNFELTSPWTQKSGVGADQLSIIIPIIREPNAHNQYQLLQSCESIILEVLTHGVTISTTNLRPNGGRIGGRKVH